MLGPGQYDKKNIRVLPSGGQSPVEGMESDSAKSTVEKCLVSSPLTQIRIGKCQTEKENKKKNTKQQQFLSKSGRILDSAQTSSITNERMLTNLTN